MLVYVGVCQCVRIVCSVCVHMACERSYTVVIVPLQNSLYSSDALQFFYWLKRLRALEREKDCLCTGLQVLDQARYWYQHQLKQISQRHARSGTGDQEDVNEGWSCALRSCMQRVNGSLGNLLNSTWVWSSTAPEEKNGMDWNLRWTNATLTQEVSQKNQQITELELEKKLLLQRDYAHYV